MDLGKLAEKSPEMARLLGDVITADFLLQQDESFSAQLISPNQPDAVSQNTGTIKNNLTVVQQNTQAILDDINAGTFNAARSGPVPLPPRVSTARHATMGTASRHSVTCTA